MKYVFRTILAASLAVCLASCSSMQKMTKLSDGVTVVCDPAVLEVVEDEIAASVKVTYPSGYFNPKAIMEVTPVLVYEGGEALMTPFMYQGEKVKDNYKTVSSAGQTVYEKVLFHFVDGMENSRLELRSKVLSGKKEIALPTKKVAEGAITTYKLVKRAGNVSLKEDAYKDTYTVTEEGQIKYLVGSSSVRSSELDSKSVQAFKEALEKVRADERAKVTGTEIVAYASPEGEVSMNNELSDKRSETAGKAWDKITKGLDTQNPELRSVGEDWEGFQKAVSESDIEDRDLILRVLSMYSDPVVRENEIKNMSEVYTALKGEVLPELRRARLIANVEYTNYTAEELLALLEDNADVLDEEALLRAATLVQDPDQKESVYQKAIDRFGSERAKFNLAATYVSRQKDNSASSLLSTMDRNDPDVMNAKGVVALHRDDLEEAESLFRKSGTDDAKANLGIVYILTGRYDEAVSVLKDLKGCCHNIALAYILTDQIDKAWDAIHCECPKCQYLRAIICARKDDAEGVDKWLAKAYKDPQLRKRAQNDIEFAGYEI